MVADGLGSDKKPVFASGRGSMKRVVTITGDNTAIFQGCEDWNGWEPELEITSADTFAEWYNTGPNNEEVDFEIPLTEESPGSFVYDSSAFFPVDSLGLTAGAQHNLSLHDRDPSAVHVRGRPEVHVPR